MAAEFTVTNGLSLLELLRCTNSAASSLPVPVSPVMRILLSVDAALERYVFTSCIGRLSPIITPALFGTGDRAAWCDFRRMAWRKHCRTAPAKSVGLHGN